MNNRIVIDKPGGTEVLRLLDEPLPVPKKREVGIRVRASGVAFGDVLLRKGGVPDTKYPITPGYDLVGEVETLGSASTRFKIGDPVAAIPATGGYTTYICLPESDLVPVPDNLAPADVVSVLLNYTTAFRLLTRAAKLRAGNSVLMHGGAGGVGTAVLQVGKLLGITVYGTVSTGKMDFVRQEGGIPIDYTQTDFVREVERLTGQGVDAVLDPIGGSNLSRSYKALKPGGTLVMFGASSSVTGDGNPILSLIKTMIRFLSLKLRFDYRHVVTSFLTANRKYAGINDDTKAMLQFLSEGKIHPIVAKTFPLSEAAQAQAMLEQTKPIGKIVLLP